MIDYYMITTGRPAKCLKLRSQLSPVQADDSVSYHLTVRVSVGVIHNSPLQADTTA